MIDLHCHILAGVDDGPATREESIALSRALAAAGVRTVAATPHLRDDHPGVVPGELAGRCHQLQAEIELAGVELEVVAGGEVDLLWALEATDEDLRLASYAQRGSDLLLEAPYGPLPPSFEQHLFDLSVRGFRVLLAHPERNPTFQAEPGRLSELVRRGVLVQVTADALLRSPRRSRSARLAHDLLREEVAHVLASDAHAAVRTRQRADWDGLEVARSLAGAQAEWMVTDAPRAVLEGEPLPGRPARGKSRKWWKRRQRS